MDTEEKIVTDAAVAEEPKPETEAMTVPESEVMPEAAPESAPDAVPEPAPKVKTKGWVKAMRVLVFAVCIVAAVGSLAYIGHYFLQMMGQHEIDKTVGGIISSLSPPPSADVNTPAAAPSDATPEPGVSAVPTKRPLTFIELVDRNKERFKELLDINSDFKGIISIPELGLEYPFVQGLDNYYYLEYDFYNKRSSYGAILLDAENSYCGVDQNTTLYGHNMRNGSMFKKITGYKNLETLKKAPYIYTDALSGTATWVIFAAYVSEADWGFDAANQPDEEALADYLREIEARSMWHSNIEVTNSDKILTMVTCDYSFQDARFVVQARMLREGEELDIEYVKNPKVKAPIVDREIKLSAIANRAAGFVLHPRMSRYYMFSAGDGDNIVWYTSSSLTMWQGPYIGYDGEVNTALLNNIASEVVGYNYYLAFNGAGGDSPGIYLLKSGTMGSHYALVSNKPVTPEGVDAKYPVLQTDSNDILWLLYSVVDEEYESIYRMPALGGTPGLLGRYEPGTGARAVGVFETENGELFIWQENGEQNDPPDHTGKTANTTILYSSRLIDGGWRETEGLSSVVGHAAYIIKNEQTGKYKLCVDTGATPALSDFDMAVMDKPCLPYESEPEPQAEETEPLTPESGGGAEPEEMAEPTGP